MKDTSSPAKISYDTTPATLGDLEIWGNRLLEMMDENKEELKTEFKAEIKEFRNEVSTRMGNFEDKQNDLILLVKSIDKKLSKE